MKRLRFRRKPLQLVSADKPNADTDNKLKEDEEGDEDDDIVKGGNPYSFPVTDNVTVEDRLGHLGLLCIEDVIEEVSGVARKWCNVTALKPCNRLLKSSLNASIC